MNRLPIVDASMNFMLDDALRQAGPAQAIDQVLRAMRREWRLLLLIGGITAAATGAYLALLEPRYTAEAIVMAAPRQSDIATSDAMIRAGMTQPPDVEGELQIMNAPASLARVVKDLGLVSRAEQAAADDEVAAASHDAVKTIATKLSRYLGPAALDLSAAAKPDQHREVDEKLVDQMGSATLVTSIGRSTLARIRLTATDPALAAEAANAVAENYLANRVRGRQDVAERAADWLQRRAQDLRGHVLDAEKRVADLRLELQANGRDLPQINAEMTGLIDRILQARTEQERATNRLASAEAVIQRSGLLALLDWDNAGGADRYVDRLRTNAAEAGQEVGRLSIELGSESLAVRRAQAQRRIAQGQMEGEARARLAALQTEATAAATLVNTMEARLKGLRAQANELGSRQAQFDAAQLEVNANRAVYETLLARWRTTAQVGFNDTDGWLVSPASVPSRQAWPQIPLVVAAALAAGLGLCITIIGFREFRRSRTLRNPDDMARQLGTEIRYLGLVPELPRRSRNVVKAILKGKPRDFLESTLALQDRLTQTKHLSHAPFSAEPGTAGYQGTSRPENISRGNIVAIVSAVTQEGKSTTLASLATAAAFGQKVAIVDCDLHSPWQQAAFGVGPCPGVAAYVAGEVNTAQAAGKLHEASGVFVLPAGRWAGRSQQFARSPRLAQLLAELRKDYDLILIDTPPMLVASDARSLCQLADNAVLVVRWGRTPVALVRLMLQQLQEMEAPLAGTVLSRVDMARFATFDFAAAGTFRRRSRPALTASPLSLQTSVRADRPSV